MNKILIVTTVPETLLLILAGQPAFLSDHLEVELATSPAHDDSVLRLRASERVRVHTVAMNRGISPFRDIISIIRMCRVIRSSGPDIVHSYTPKAGLVAMSAAWMCRVPVRVHTFTGLVFLGRSGLVKRLLITADSAISSFATVIIPEGKGVADQLLLNRVTKKTLTFVGNGNIAGIDTSYFKPSDGYKRIDGNFVFVYIGRLNSDKGIGELVSAFSRLPSFARLKIVGALDSAAPVSDEVLARINDDDRIEWLGFQADVRPVLNGSDVLVLPSYREGFPNVLLEAGSMGLPCIVTNVTGSNEIVVSHETGWVVEPKDVKGLEAAMLDAIYLKPEELADRGSKARQRIKQLFERNEYLKSLLQFYCSVEAKYL